MTTQTTQQPNQTMGNQPNAPVSFDVQQPVQQQASQDPVGNQQQTQQAPQDDKKIEPFKTFVSQQDYDNEIAKIRGVYEHKAEANILKSLGLKPEDKDKLAKFKEAYEASLTKEEKQEEALKQLHDLQASISEKDAIITALTKLSGKTSEDVIKFVKMAKGLVSEETSIEQALDEVMELAKAKTQPKPQVSSQPLNQGSDNGTIEKNPFKEGADFNVTEQGRLIKSDPVKARELAKRANYPINF